MASCPPIRRDRPSGSCKTLQVQCHEQPSVKGPPPLRRVEILAPTAISIFGPNKPFLRIKDIAIVLCFLIINLSNVLTPQRFGKASQAPVGIGILKSFGCSFRHLRIGYIAQRIVPLVTVAPYRRDISMPGLRLMQHGFQQLHGVYGTDTFHPGIYRYRQGIVAYHAASVSRAGPFRQETTFFVSIQQRLLNLFTHLGIK